MVAADFTHPSPRRGRLLGLAALVVGFAGGALALHAIAGPPRLPAELPTWDALALAMQGTYLPLETVAYLLATAAWVVWFWIVGSLVLRFVMVVAETVTHGAAWVRYLRAISDRATLPIVRRLVDGALVAIIVVNLVGRTTPTASALTLTPPAPLAAASAAGEPWSSGHTPGLEQSQKRQTVEYEVQAGDTLWAIAERFYGTGHEYPRLVEANAGRQMADGRRFTQAGVIHPGWTLLVQTPSRTGEQPVGQSHYTVERGDTLRGIAARLLGDESRWPEIFEMNCGVARLDDGRTLRDPGLIWPGLRLEMPAPATEGREPRQAMPAPGPTQPEVEASPTEPAISIEPLPSPTQVALGQEPAVPSTPAWPDDAPVVAEPEQAQEQGSPLPISLGVVGIAGAAGAAGVLLLARRRVRRSLDDLPVRPMVEDASGIGSGFVEAEFARALAHRLHGAEVEPVVLAAEQTLRFLREQGLGEVSVVMARHGLNGTTLTLSAGLQGQLRLVELAGELGARLGGSGGASITPDQDVEVQLSGLRLAQLAGSMNGSAEFVRLLAIGVLSRGQTLYANWREIGHVLMAGLPGAGVDVALATVDGALAARFRPEELQLWSIGSRRTLPEQFVGLPHQQMGFVDPGNEDDVNELLRRLRMELVRRMQGRVDSEGGRDFEPRDPDVVLVIGELADLRDGGTTVEMIGVHGPAYGIHLLAATTQLAALGDDALVHFGTRLVLQTLNEEESIRLLGHPEAADLSGGEILVRLEGRRPVRARGFRISAERLDELVRLMRDTLGSPDARPGIPVPEPRETTIGNPPAAQGTGGSWAVHAAALAGEEECPVALPTRAVEGRPAHPAVGIVDPCPEDSPARDRDAEAILTEETVPAEVADTDGDVPNTARRAEHADTEEVEVPELPTGVAALPEYGSSSTRGAPRGNGHCPEPVPADHLVPPEEEPWVGDRLLESTSLLQIRCFGGFSVTSGDQEISPSSEEGSSFKAWEVLAFLAAQPDGAIPKDKLLEALWPEVDAERSANRMRVAMARLRALLARQIPGLSPEVVRCERDGTCRLDTRLVDSDVHRFVALCRSASKLPSEEAKAALRQARALYGGDLLLGQGAGSHVWVEERTESGLSLREAYREEYNRATQRLARLLCREGRHTEAIPLYKSLLKAEPTLEDVVRDLYRCYQQTGDLSSLIREDRHLRQAIREAYCDPDDPEDDPNDYQPEPETVELFREIRTGLETKTALGQALGLHRRQLSRKVP